MANREYQDEQFRNRGRFEQRARGEDEWESEGGAQWPGRDEDFASTRHMRPGGGERARTWSSEGARRERRGYGERRGWGLQSQGESGERGTRDFEEDRGGRGYAGSERGYGAERGPRDYELGERGDGDEWRYEAERYGRGAGRGRGFGGARSGYRFGDEGFGERPFEGRYDEPERDRDRRFGSGFGSPEREPEARYGRHGGFFRRGAMSGRFAGRGPKGYERSDDRIREDVCDRLMDDPEVDASNLTVDVRGGEVILEGSVDSKEAKRCAEDIAEQVSGVREVQNRLRVDRSAQWQTQTGGAYQGGATVVPSFPTPATTAGRDELRAHGSGGGVQALEAERTESETKRS